MTEHKRTNMKDSEKSPILFQAFLLIVHHFYGIDLISVADEQGILKVTFSIPQINIPCDHSLDSKE